MIHFSVVVKCPFDGLMAIVMAAAFKVRAHRHPPDSLDFIAVLIRRLPAGGIAVKSELTQNIFFFK